MKNIINYLLAHCAIAILFFVNVATAQTPNSFRYQAVVRNASGLTLQTQNVNLRITLLQGTTTGTSVYSEEHTVTTNEFGMVNIEIGSGSTQIGTIAGIDWANGPYFIKIELDATGGNSFVEMGTTQLLSVPYALYAASGTEGPQGIQGVQGPAGQDGQQGVQGEQGVAGQNGISILWLGTFAASPANPVLNNAYYNSTDKKSYVFDGSTWQILAQDGATGAQGIQGTQGLPGTNATIHSGTGISISNDTIYNTNLGSAINLTGSGATSVSGTYPNITISSTDNNTVYSAGSGLSLSGTTFNSVWSNNVNNIYNNNGGNVGIGTSTPLSSLHIQGSLRINDDTEGSGKVLTSDLSGNASWQTPAIGSSLGTANYIPKFLSASELDNSLLYQNGEKIGIGTTSPTGRLQIQADPTAHDTIPLFEIKDKYNKTVMVVYQDSVHFFIKDPGGSKAENKGAFAVSGKNSTKNFTSNFFHLNTSNLFSGRDAGQKLSSPVNYTGYSNNFLGFEAGFNDTSGYKNTFLGYRSGYSNTSGFSNIFIGDSAGFLNTSGYKNVFIGNQSGKSNSSGNYNVFLGYNTGFSNLASYNVFLGYESGRNNSSGFSNSFIGYLAGRNNSSGNRNVFMGDSAGYSNITGSYNVFLGKNAGLSTNSNYNVFIGFECGKSNGSYVNNNVFIGYKAGSSNTTAPNSVMIGSEAGMSNTTGAQNIFIGAYAGNDNTTGQNNVFIGRSAGVSSNAGHNTLVGNLSGLANTSGNYNTAFGYNALYSNTTGNSNTAIGNAAFSSGTNFSNSTALGSGVAITASNMVRIGNTSVTSIGGQVGWTTVSDARFKKNITENVHGLDFITKLRPVTYYHDMNAIAKLLQIPDSLRDLDAEALAAEILRTGFIAQEIDEISKQLGYDFSGLDKPKNNNDFYGLRYAEFTVPLVKAVQELNEKEILQQNKFSELQKIIVNLQSENKRLREDNSTLKINNENLKSDIEQIKAFLKINKN